VAPVSGFRGGIRRGMAAGVRDRRVIRVRRVSRRDWHGGGPARRA
jgi:hypothetical protein